MINRAEMAMPSEIAARFPIFTDKEVQRILSSRIVDVRRSLLGTIFMGETYAYEGLSLFSFTREEFSHLKDRDGDITGRVESDRLQELGLGIMKEYGLDENISLPEYHNRGWTTDGVINDRNGTSREILLYPSQTTSGLAFRREKTFITATGEPLSVSWKVAHKAPMFYNEYRK